MQPDVRARLPFQTLSSKLQGQMPVMEIHSLVSKGITTRTFGFQPFGAPAAAMPLEDQRRKTQQTVDRAIEKVQGWRDRAALMQCLNSVVPMESNLGICKGSLSDALNKYFITLSYQRCLNMSDMYLWSTLCVLFHPW